MRIHFGIIVLAASLALSACCGNAPGQGKCEKAGSPFPEISQDGKTAIVAHRGYWQCEEGGFSRNSIAALKAAQDNGFWGSECDIQLTKDDQIIVFHDPDLDGKNFIDYDFAEFSDVRLPNGEPIPTFDSFLAQVERCSTTKLVIEFKPTEDIDTDSHLVDKAFGLLKAHGVYDPDRVLFISFSLPVCLKVAAEAPEFVNQYLRGDMTPEELEMYGINGLDYHDKVILANRYYPYRAHMRGMSVNSWTVNDEQVFRKMLLYKVDAVTTDDPMMARGILGENELNNR